MNIQKGHKFLKANHFFRPEKTRGFRGELQKIKYPGSREKLVDSYMENSLTSGTKWDGLILARRAIFCCRDLALLAFNMRERMFLLCLIGMSDRNSTPPATMVS